MTTTRAATPCITYLFLKGTEVVHIAEFSSSIPIMEALHMRDTQFPGATVAVVVGGEDLQEGWIKQ